MPQITRHIGFARFVQICLPDLFQRIDNFAFRRQPLVVEFNQRLYHQHSLMLRFVAIFKRYKNHLLTDERKKK